MKFNLNNTIQNIKALQEMTPEEENESLKLKLNNYESIKENLDIKERAIKNLLKSLPKSFLIRCIEELKIIKVDYVTKEVREK
jgi:hypothetical protein